MAVNALVDGALLLTSVAKLIIMRRMVTSRAILKAKHFFAKCGFQCLTYVPSRD